MTRSKRICYKSYATVIVCVSTSMYSVIKTETLATIKIRQAADLSRRNGKQL